MTKGNHPFASLSGLKDDLQARREEKERLARLEEQKRLEQQAKAREFENAMKELGVVKKNASEQTFEHPKPQPPAHPFQTEKDNQAVLVDSLSDHFAYELYLDSDEKLSYRAKNMAPDIPKKLRAGTWSIKGSLDLHGYTADEARALLALFLTEERKVGHRAVRIIHGQGYGSFQRKGILKERVPGWLAQRKDVLAFVEAPPHDGGAGALYVLLAPK